MAQTDEIEVTDLPQAIDRAIERTSGLAGGKPISVVAEYPAHLPSIRAESEDLAQAITNLIEYAILRTESGEVRIRAQLSESSSEEANQPLPGFDDPQAWVTIGFPMGAIELQEDLPKPLSDSVQLKREGSEHLRRILEATADTIAGFGGEIWLDRESQDRLKFEFSLPLHAMHVGSEDKTGLRGIVQSYLPEQEEAAKTLLLVVEDDALRELLSSELVETGYRVISAGEGAEIIPLAREEKPDLILLDLMFRDPTALDIAMVLKQDRRTLNIPVLFLTSMEDPQLGNLRLGAVDFLVRPTGTGALINTIQQVLQSGISPTGRVLVVETDDALRETMVLVIQQHGFRVTEARSTEEALALAEHLAPELVLVNARMARERDYWLLRGLRQIRESMDVMVLAEAISEEEGQAAVSRGASGFGETGKLAEILSQVRRNRGKS